MDRIREARRGNMAAVNGGLARRRQRSSSLRDSPDEDGGMEMQETVRLRDRVSKKDRDRDRSGRNKRRRGDRMMHGSHREEGDDSSEESLDEDDDDEEDESTVSVSVRLPPPSAPNPTPVAPVIQNHHLRKGFPVKSARAPGTGTWKVVEEMIGAPIPRKARSSSVKRSQECWLSGGGAAAGGGGGDVVHRQSSMSPARPSPTSTTPVSPSSSNVSVRKKVQKPISGSKQRLSKSSKTSSIQEIEIEVAEVLFGMTRHVPLKQEEQKHDLKESNGSGAEVKSRLSSPYPISSPIATSPAATRPSNPSSNSAPPTAIAPKRKLPRKRFEDESPTSPPNTAPVLPATSNSSAAKMDVEPAIPPAEKTDTSPRSEKKSLVVESIVSSDPAVSTTSSAVKMHQDASKSENMMAKEEAICQQKESTSPNLDVKIEEDFASKAVVISESQREDKFSFDLMALPGRSSPEMENSSDYVAECKSVEMELAPKPELSKGEELEKTEKKSKTESDEILNNGCKVEDSDNLKKQPGKERNLELLLDLEKIDKDVSGSSKNQQTLKHQSRAPQKIEKSGLPTSSSTSPMTMQIPGWPGGFPPFGYMGPVPSLPPVVPLDGSSTSSKTVQSFLPSSQLRPKRCAAHCYIAQNIHYHQQITRLNPFWPSAAGAAPMYAAKQYNLNTAPPSDAAIIAGALPGSVPGRSMGSVQEKSGQVLAAHSGHSSKDKNCASSAQFVDAASQRKVPPAAAAIHQSAQPGSAGNMLAPAAFIFPMHQQQAQAVVQAATVGAANRSGVAAKLSQASGNAAPPSTMAVAAASGANGPGTTMNFNYPGLPQNEQYLAFLQNSTYSFPIPAHVGGAPSYRAANSGQTLPYFNLSFYSPGMIHPTQLRMQQPPPPSQAPPPYSQQGHQNPSTSSGSSSSQKNTQQSQRVPAAAGSTAAVANSHGFPSKQQQQQQQQQLLQQARQIEPEPVSEDAPSTADSRVSQAQKGMYAQKFSIPAHSQNFALIAPAATALSGGGGHGDKQQQAQNQMMKMDLTPSQAFAMSFASFGGAAGASTGAPPHGFDFSSMSQNHALFQSLPEPTRQGYQVSAAAHSAQQRHSNGKKVEDAKTSPDLGNTNAPNEEVKSSPANKPMINSQQQQSLTFTRADTEPPMSSIINNSMMDGSSRTLNLIQQPPNGAPRVSNRPASAPAPNPMTAAAHGSNSPHVLSQQHQQQVLQLQKQHQQLQMQQQLQQQQQQRAKPAASHTSANVYSDRLPGNSAAASKYAQGLAGFPPALTQSSASAQSAQWKTASRATNPPSSAASPAIAVPPPSSLSSKNQMPLQQQVRGQQPLAAHQPHQISFGVSPGKAAGQLGPASNVGSPQNSVSKSSGGSPHSSSTIPKSAPPPSAVLPPVLPFQKQQQPQQGKNSSSSSNSPLPAVNRNMPSILGNPHNTSPTTPQHMSSKQLPSSQHLQQSQMSKQHFPQAQFFFSNPYMQTQNSQSDMVAAAAAGYFQQHHRRQSDQAQSQARQNSLPATTGMLSLGPSSSSLSLTGGGGPAPDQSKGAAVAAQAMNNNSKSLTPAGLMQQHQAQFAAASQPGSGAASAGHPMMPYIHAMQSVPLKPDVSASGEQKPAAGR